MKKKKKAVIKRVSEKVDDIQGSDEPERIIIWISINVQFSSLGDILKSIKTNFWCNL